VVSLGVIFLGLDGIVSTGEGLILLLAAGGYTFFIISGSRRENESGKRDAGLAVDVADKNPADEDPQDENPGGKDLVDHHPAEAGAQASGQRRGWVRNGLFLAFGLGGLVLGAHWLVEGASGIARIFGVSELIIGLTMVAVGTSLPELATSVAATLRGERDLVIGNVVGSNLFNLLFVLGLGALVVPGGLAVPASSISFDLPVMLAVTAASLPIFFSGYIISRWEGGLFLSYYAAYVLYLFLFSVEHDFLPRYSTIMLRYILPPTALLLVFVSLKAFRSKRRGD
jgi:cation:H+ antiporter